MNGRAARRASRKHVDPSRQSHSHPPGKEELKRQVERQQHEIQKLGSPQCERGPHAQLIALIAYLTDLLLHAAAGGRGVSVACAEHCDESGQHPKVLGRRGPALSVVGTATEKRTGIEYRRNRLAQQRGEMIFMVVGGQELRFLHGGQDAQFRRADPSAGGCSRASCAANVSAPISSITRVGATVLGVFEAQHSGHSGLRQHH